MALRRPLSAAIILVSTALGAGCSPPAGTAPGAPSVTFSSSTATPGMSGMSGMPGMPPMSGTLHSADAPAPATVAAPRGANAVDITDFVFAPDSVTVPVGATVTWTNRDEEPHIVAAGDGSFHSPGMGTGDTYSFTFATAGSFDYICSIHPFMHGTVVVTR